MITMKIISSLQKA